MSLFIPRFAYAPVRCSPSRHEVAPLFSLFDDALAEVQRASRHSRKQWSPRFDVKETKEAYLVDAEIPGVDPKNVSVEFIDEHTLAVKGRSERHTEKGNKPAVEAVEAASAPEGTATPASETASLKSHQATVEDEEPAHTSAAQESSEVAQHTEAATEKPQEVAKTEEQKPQEQYWFSERRIGSFQRQFAFASRVDQEQVKASLKNGLLSIIVPKAAAPESRRINIE